MKRQVLFLMMTLLLVVCLISAIACEEEHVHTEVVDAAVAATCTTTGLTEGKHCSVCEEVLVAQTVVEKVAHTEVVDSAVAATCTTTGMTEGKHCSVCEEVLVAQTVVEKVAHTEVVDQAVSATCTTIGLTEGKHCSVCSTVTIAQQQIEKLPHNLDGNGICAVCTESHDAVIIGDTGYSTIQAAITASESGDVLKVANNICLSTAINIAIDKNIALDLNGKQITVVQNPNNLSRTICAIENYGTLVIQDSSTLKDGTITTRLIDNYGTMTMKSGTIVSCDVDGGAAVWNNPAGTFNMEGGKLYVSATHTQSGNAPSTLINQGTANITGGVLESLNDLAYSVKNLKGTLTIQPALEKSVAISGIKGGLSVEDGVTNIYGGNFSSANYYGLYVTGTNGNKIATVNVYGGNFTGKNLSVWIGHDEGSVTVNSVINISGGTFEKFIGKNANAVNAYIITGGSFTEDPSMHVDISNYDVVLKDNLYIVSAKVV